MFGTAAVVSPVVARILAVVLVIVALIGGGMYIHHSGYQKGYATAEAEGQVKLDKYKEAQRLEIERVRSVARQVEMDLQTKLLQSLSEKEDAIKQINATHDRLVSSLRNRASRTDPSPVTISTPVITTFECTRKPGTGEELSREDGEFLIGEATSADILREALKQCREAYKRVIEGAYKIE
jgi:hypothetical protein